MRTQKNFSILFATVALTLFAGVTESRADACSASASTLLTRSAGGTCPDALEPDEEFTMTVRITNASIIDDPGSGNDGDPVEATIAGGTDALQVLAKETSGTTVDPLPGVLEFIPVCVNDAAANAGDPCNVDADCGGSHCGCVSRQPGVECSSAGANSVRYDFTQPIAFNGGEQKDIATIRVRRIGSVTTSTCGQFYSRVDSTGDILATTDADCDAENTAGAQASADLHAPECVSNADCTETCEVCTDNECVPAAEGSPCEGDGVACTEDVCDDEGNCDHNPDDAFCDDADECTTEVCDPLDDCIYTFICEAEAICRSPGYWSTHSGSEKGGENVGQLVIDTVGPLEVCGQTISDTDALGSLDSSLEGLCMRAKGVSQRRLYRHLVATAFNCAVSGGDCDSVVAPFINVSFSDCSDLCEGNPVVDGPTLGECVHELDCFNNGGQMIAGECVFGTCASEPEIYCDGDAGDCPLFEDEPQECIPFPGNCHDAVLCNEAIDICPKKTPASSPKTCREARGNDCTIDSCN